MPNYDTVEFPPVKARRVRVLLTPTPGFGIGLKEIQVFDVRPPRQPSRRLAEGRGDHDRLALAVPAYPSLGSSRQSVACRKLLFGTGEMPATNSPALAEAREPGTPRSTG